MKCGQILWLCWSRRRSVSRYEAVQWSSSECPHQFSCRGCLATPCLCPRSTRTSSHRWMSSLIMRPASLRTVGVRVHCTVSFKLFFMFNAQMKVTWAPWWRFSSHRWPSSSTWWTPGWRTESRRSSRKLLIYEPNTIGRIYFWYSPVYTNISFNKYYKSRLRTIWSSQCQDPPLWRWSGGQSSNLW